MKTVTIRELHARTGELVRAASRHGEIRVTDNGRIVAKILPERETAAAPYFARRKFLSPAVRRLIESGDTGRGTDSTLAISEEREDRVTGLKEVFSNDARLLSAASHFGLKGSNLI